MRKIVRLTERDLTRLVKQIIREGYEDDYTASGFDSMGDAAHSDLKSKGHSHRGKDDEGEFYIVFDGEKFYEDDFEIAGRNDMGKIPRVEDGKLIIANPAWGS
jgi:RNA binding exosome subunit